MYTYITFNYNTNNYITRGPINLTKHVYLTLYYLDNLIMYFDSRINQTAKYKQIYN